MKRIRIIALLAAVVMFGCLFLLMSGMGGGSSDKAQEENPSAVTVTVVRATADIPAYTVINERMLETKEMIVDSNFHDYFEKKEDVAGLVAASDIFKGDIVSPKRTAENKDVAGGLAYRIQEGMRAVTIDVNTEQGVANTIKVGNYVDVIFTGEVEALNGGGATSAAAVFDTLMDGNSPANTQIIHDRVGKEFALIAMQKLKVLALDDKFFNGTGDSVTGNTYDSVTLEVTPAQAAQIVLLKQKADIYLTLRGQEDEGIVNETRDSVIKRYSATITETP